MKNNNIENAYNEFSSRVTNILYYKNIVQSHTTEIYNDLLKRKENFSKSTLPTEILSSHHSMRFTSPIDGESITFGRMSVNIDESIKHTLYQKNKQYLWLLVEAYEYYEDFLEELYACVGYSNSELWPLSDFGKIYHSDLVGKDYSFYLDKARSQKNTKEILKYFRSKIPDLKNIERNNENGTNFLYLVSLISKLRHIIVHNGGVINDLGVIIDRIYSDAELPKSENSYSDDIKFYFSPKNSAYHVEILEYRINNHFLQPYHDTCSALIEGLAAHAYLIHSKVTVFLKDK
ncbi:hypothetical protein [Photobacterium ganghwense]|uniref:hypothetical protein n=1 Tax=Photobacterium ganghwense TaxID=320778 RepID=UPI001A8D5C1C|nr:hypothetical protein [Photobacterium ganghwense]QSV17304.1 hypothetical protein FH974_20465 [Photobacterium ganghwense]